MKPKLKIERYKPFSSGLEDMHLKNRLRWNYATKPFLQITPIDIILPTFNRANQLTKAIESVRGQLHQFWNLYICDDGSTDNTNTVCGQFNYDNRIKYLKLRHNGVSLARNYGLKISKNEYIAFLDSDNTWKHEYLSLMISFMDFFNLESAFCAARLIGDNGDQWLGDVFSWQACAEKNYIDINCFMTKERERKIFFDLDLKRFVDWDYILNLTREKRTSYLPVPLVDYCNRRSRDRITTTVYQGEADKYIDSIRRKHSESMDLKNNIDARLMK